jgi:tetratricopeptide (TPR) repeat protein
MALSDQANEPGAVVLGHCCLGIDFFFSGDLEQALLNGQDGWEAYEKVGGGPLGAIYGYDPGVLCCELYAWSLLAMGYPDQADKVYAKAIDRALLHGHPLTVATTKAHLAFFDALREDPITALATAVDAVAFCADNSILLRQAEAQIVQGWAISESGESDKGVPVIEAGITLWQQLGAHIFDSNWYLLLAKASVCARRLSDARAALQSAFKAATDNREHVVMAELHRFDGELHLVSSGADAEARAEQCFESAIDLARPQKAKLWELRAAVSMASLWHQQGKQKEARDLLAPVYNWFTEGFDTKDLKEAKALLDELSV